MDIEKARFNMIEQQIRPWDVLDPDILEAIALVKREDFVPAAYRGMAFADVELPIRIDEAATGQTMLAPRVEARLLQALQVKRHESALEIGTGSGYGTALLAQRTRRIVSLEIDPRIAAFGAANLARAGLTEIRLQAADGASFGGQETFDVIVLSGSVPVVPQALLDRLNPGGRLVAIVGEAPTMTADLITRTGATNWSTTHLFETVAPRLAGFPAPDRFRF